MKHLLPLILSTLLIDPAIAGEQSNLRFLAANLPDGIGELTWLAGKTEGEAITLSTEHLSAPVTMPERAFVLQAGAEKRLLATITLPAEGESFVVLLAGEPAGTLKPFVFPTTDPAFCGGDVFLFNSSDGKIFGKLGSTDFELAPLEGKAVRPGGDLSEGSYPVEFNVREEAGDRVLRTLRWPVQTRSRSYCFFFKNPAKDRIEFRTVEEFVEPAKKGGKQR
jgi:hypothetical protein